MTPSRVGRGGIGRGGIDAFSLAGLLIRFRIRAWRNGLRAGRRAGQAVFAAALGLVIAFAYVGLFAQAFATLAALVPVSGQVTALAAVTATIALASLTARAASNEAVRAGSGENELMLSRPVALPALVAARGLADAVTDPVAGLFLLPVLIAAAMVWEAGGGAIPVAIATSMLVQLTSSMLAYTVQLAVVRYVPPLRRRAVWMGLRLAAALALAALWMVGSGVMRSPAGFGRRLVGLADSPLLAPGRLLVAPLAAIQRGEAFAALLGLAALAAAAAAATAVAVSVARRAGMKGWEEAGAVWSEAASSRSDRGESGLVISAATKDLRLIRRDRPQLLALVAMPVIFVGVQVFGAAGFDPRTASVEVVACLAYSLALYLATIGPLAHMQAERRAFWILRTVPVPLGRLFAAKARAWSAVVATAAALAFLPLAAAVPGAGALEVGGTAVLVLVGTTGMTFLAIGMAASGADLSDEQRPAVSPGVIYGFLLVGGLYNLVLVGDLRTRLFGIAFYAFVTVAYFVTGVEHAGRCMDAELVRERRLRLADGATMALVTALVGRGIAVASEQRRDLAIPTEIAGWLHAASVALVGGAAAVYLRARPAGRRSASAWSSVIVALGAGALAAALGWAAVGGTAPAFGYARLAGALPVPVLALAALLLVCEELVFRGVIQRALGEALERRLAPAKRAVGWPRALAAALGCVIATVATELAAPAGGGPARLTAAMHLGASLAFAATGRLSSAWLARLAALAAAAFAPSILRLP